MNTVFEYDSFFNALVTVFYDMTRKAVIFCARSGASSTHPHEHFE
jgi:hypothetical protein